MTEKYLDFYLQVQSFWKKLLNNLTQKSLHNYSNW